MYAPGRSCPIDDLFSLSRVLRRRHGCRSNCCQLLPPNPHESGNGAALVRAFRGTSGALIFCSCNVACVAPVGAYPPLGGSFFLPMTHCGTISTCQCQCSRPHCSARRGNGCQRHADASFRACVREPTRRNVSSANHFPAHRTAGFRVWLFTLPTSRSSIWM